MSHSLPEFETKDDLGRTQHFNGSVGASPLSIPAVASKQISRVMIRCSNSNSFNKYLQVSLENGLTYWTLQKGELIDWNPKRDSGGNEIKQIKIVGSDASVDYEIIMDFEQ